MDRLRIFMIVVVVGATWHADKAQSQQPNFLWIMSEDNSKHYLKMFDEMGAATPNIEKMAMHGVVFNRAFSNAPVCSVARTTLFTSVHAPRLGTQFHRRLKPAAMPNSWKMFPAYLREAGYYTTNNAKKDYNVVEGAGVWDASSQWAHWRDRPRDKPFFHVQTYTDSHESSLHFDQSWVDHPDNQTDPGSVQLAPYHPDTALFRLTYARYHDRIQSIDEKVGKLIEQLRDDGELENTFVFYFGDHGGVLPRGKGFINESGLHVPLVVRVPEKWRQYSCFELGNRTDGFVEFVDFGPTVLNLAGIPVPAHVDGRPFLGPGVVKQEVDSRAETLGYADRMDEKYDLCRSLRRGNLKYIRNYQAIYPDGLQNNYRYLNLAWRQWRAMYHAGDLNEKQKTFFEPKPPEQLFDLDADPHEVNNLAAEPAYREQLLEMRGRLSTRLKSLPDLSFYPESHLVQFALDNPVEFGNQHRRQIGVYIDIADAVFSPTSVALTKIDTALRSNDPWARYWGYSACSIMGKSANPLFELADQAMASDDNQLVRLRAAEFLGLAGHADPIPTIREILETSDSAAVNLIALQTLVLFKDGPFPFDDSLDTSKIKVVDEQVVRRIAYIDGLSAVEVKQRVRDLQKRTRAQRRK